MADEVGGKSENPHIPPNWHIAESGEPIVILRLDQDQGYLAIRDRLGLNGFSHREKEYIFNSSEGEQMEPVMDRAYNWYAYHGNLPRPEVDSVVVSQNLENRRQYYLDQLGDTSALTVILNLDTQFDSKRQILNCCGSFHNGALFSARVESNYVSNPDEPRVEFIFDGDSMMMKTDTHGPYKRVNDDSQKIFGKFEIGWRTVKDKDINGNDVDFFVVEQINTQNGVAKTFRVPKVINIKKISQAMLSKPPYQKDPRTGRLDIPWRDIDRMVGANLITSEQNPAQIQQRANPNIR